MNNDVNHIWHDGEISVQKKAGTFEKMCEIGPKFIREFMPEQHREFFESLNMIFIGYFDYASHIMSTMVFGQPTFITSPTPNTLLINTQQTMGDLLIGELNIGDKIGLIGIEFATKRRNRVNAVIIDIAQKSILIEVLQSYGNCPKYIQPKSFINNPEYGDFKYLNYDYLTDHIREVIKLADVFFISSYFDDKQSLNNRGVDISHRGGAPGFITINDDGQLEVDDYVGNGFFNTLGNLIINPIANLLFLDWKKGNTFQVCVRSEILYIPSKTEPYNKRKIIFTPIHFKHIKNSLAYIQQ